MSHQEQMLLTDILQKFLNTRPNKEAFIFLADGLIASESLTYAQLDQRARIIAAAIQAQCQENDRVLLCYSPGLEFICAFLGCLYAGVIAVPAFPYHSNQHARRLLAILEDCSPSLILGAHEDLHGMQEQAEFAAYQYLLTDQLPEELALSFRRTLILPDRLAFLQYTSGSTGQPKGVMVSQSNIMANFQAIHEYFCFEEGYLILWLPVQHDMGLIGVLYNIYRGNTCVLMSPATFLDKPLLWLRALSDYKGYVGGGPNFAYQLCVDKISEEELASLDLSHWGRAFNGSEPVSANTLAAFAHKFAVCGFQRKAFLPCYGMAETTLLISGTPKDRPDIFITHVNTEALAAGQLQLDETSPHQLVGAGLVYKSYSIRVVDPISLQITPNGKIGEIWVSGPSVTQGYWNKPEITQQSFHAHLADDPHDYLRTGDLGCFDGDELYITGRLKDLIILQGRNVYPQDIERCVEQSHDAIRKSCTAAFSVEMNNQEQLIIVAEIKRTFRKIDFKPVFQAIRKAVIDEADAIPYSIQLLSPARALKTTSGKIQRQETKKLYLSKQLPILASDDLVMSTVDAATTLEQVENDLSDLLAKILAVNDIDKTKKFTELGGTSLHAILFQQQLEMYVANRIELSPNMAFDYPTISQLSSYLFQQLTHTYISPEKIAPEIIDQDSLAFLEEPIAIIGMACRFPGNANTPETFWELLEKGQDGISEIPASRWRWQDYAEETPVRQGGFVEDLEYFDAAFFGISPREAETMDPQQRILLETTWHGLEDAGIDPKTLSGTNTDVFIGATTHEYEALLTQAHVHGNYLATGNTASVLSGRVSYELGLQGASVTLDTACSSALVAIHGACGALHLGKTQLAIVGAVNALLSPDASINLWQAGMLAPDGHCKVFSEQADGYARGEGCAVLILKKLSDAIKDHHKILAVIKGSVANQDGASSGLTVPNGVSQEKLLRDALAISKLQAHEIDYLEAHGTGTKLGDPMETYAISQVFKNTHDHQHPLFIGSVKANVGHLEAAAGMAGIIKIILSFKNKAIPPQIHVNEINSKINLSAIPASIPTELTPWLQVDRPRRAGISGFGFSGTNAHIILEEAPTQDLSQVQPSLPQTVFNHHRYWPKELDSRSAQQLVLPKEWYVTEQWVELALSTQSIHRSFKYYVWVGEKDNWQAVISSLDAQVVDENALVETLSVLDEVCVIDAYSYLNLQDNEELLERTKQLMARYQQWLPMNSHVKRWVILNRRSPDPEKQLAGSVLASLAKALNWEQTSELQYIAFDDLRIDVAAEIQYGKEAHVEYRATNRYLPRLESINMLSLLSDAQFPAIIPDTDGVYLITGGLGGLGSALLEMLLEAGLKRFILISRRTADATQEQRIASLRNKFDADITTIALDVTDKLKLQALIDLQETLKGIFHLAGNECNAAFEDYTPEQIDSILRPKIMGAWNLHELSKKHHLNYFVLFSSVAAMIGSNRQAPYVIANGYLDALARYRKSAHLPITHIQWGAWAGAGMFSREISNEIQDAQLMGDLIPLDKGMQLFKQLLPIPMLTHIGVISPSYLRFMLSFHQHLPAWLKPFAAEENKTQTPSVFLDLYYKKSANLRLMMLKNWIEQQLRVVMHFEDTAILDPEQGFFELGMDSLMAVELYERIKRELGVDLSLRPMLVFDYPSIAKLSHYLHDTLEGATKTDYIISTAYQNESIAVIGLECVFPGSESAAQFWESLMTAKDSIRSPDSLRADLTQHAYNAGFIDNIDLFAADFFNISPKEAQALDPQQRLLLEVTWHALENAGIIPTSLKESETGVFVGISQSEYGQLLAKNSSEKNFYQGTGNALNVAAGRLAYVLGLQGPTMAIDTACSSSLVAVHEACRSLQNKDCDMAIAAGVNVLLSSLTFETLTQGNMLSATGYCKTFDKDADGYVRGEGCGVVILKRLSDAEHDKDRIYAIIKGSAVNQDGASSGLTVPNGLAQERVLARALANAGVDPITVDYIEAHGTGTRLGDPIEIGAVQTIYGQARIRPLTISTVKTNIGHLESAAGIAGLIKTILVLQHEWIPQHLHFKELNPAIHLDAIPAKLPLQGLSWKKETGRIRRAGVSAFGFSGTNAHLILEEAPERDPTEVRAALTLTVFQRSSYWLPKVQKSIWTEEGHGKRHPLLQHEISLPESHDIYYESLISPDYPEFIADHIIYDYVAIAGADYLSMALAFAKEHLPARYCRLTEVEFIEVLVLNKEDKTTQLLVKVVEQAEHRWKMSVYSKGEMQQETQLRATLYLEEGSALQHESEHFEVIKKDFAKSQVYTGADHLAKALSVSLNLGPHFHWLETAYVQEGQILVQLRKPKDAIETEPYVWYPGMIDSGFQSLLALAGVDTDTLAIPFRIEMMNVDIKGSLPCWVHVVVEQTVENQVTLKRANFTWFDEWGEKVGELIGFSAQTAPRSALERAMKQQIQAPELFYKTVWEELVSVDESITEGMNSPVICDLRNQHKGVLDMNVTEYLLAFIQEQAALNEIRRTIVITEQAYSIQGESLQLGQASLNGLIKTAMLELPELKLCQVDLMFGSEINEAQLVLCSAKENIVAIRSSGIYVPRLQIVSPPNIQADLQLLAQARYLITGGLGGLGLVLAQYLAAHGAKHLVLVGRHAPNDDAQTVIRNLEAAGVEVRHISADMSKRAEVINLIHNNPTAEYPLKGVFHLAGIISDASLLQQTPEQFAKVFEPKAWGAWYLHEATQALALDYFVMFSSMASLNGSPGQSNYAAANSFLDGLAYYRQQQSLPGLSINWGPWQEVGMAKELVRSHERQGLKPLSTQEALAGLDFALCQPEKQIGIINAHWQKVSESLVHTPSWLRELMPVQATSDLILQLQSLSDEQREARLRAAVMKEIRKVLELPSNQELLEDKSFFEMGMDSLMALELKNRLQALIQQPLSNMFLFENTNLHLLLNALKMMLKISDLENKKSTSQLKREAEQYIVRLKTSQSGKNLFLLPGSIGLAQSFLPLVNLLKQDMSIFCLQSPSLFTDLNFTTLESLAAFYVADIYKIQSSSPYYLLGWSFGGLLAYEIAKQLEANHKEVKFLGVIDIAPFTQSYIKDFPSNQDIMTTLYFTADINIPLNEKEAINKMIDNMSFNELLTFAYRFIKQQAPNSFIAQNDQAAFDKTLITLKHNFELIRDYKLKKQVDNLNFFFAKERLSILPEEKLGTEFAKQTWQKHTKSKVVSVMLPGNHFSALSLPNVQTLADKLNEALDNKLIIK
jgi:acyl transferase domain-containing protein/acyl-CoA synthetase (AMP-forming)/AMP-acid ligase II/thioesterase domain-containing protein/acyl carrier protein